MLDRPENGGVRLMVGFEGQRPTDDLKCVLEETRAGSVILFARNITDASQAAELVQSIRDLVPWPLLFAIDQEGGAVLRITDGATVFPGNMALGAADDPALAERQGFESGRQLSALGFDLNLAPVVDLQTNPRNPGIGIRSLGADRDRAVRLATALVRGHTRAGVASCLKHFPGKGAADVDAHLDLPVLSATRAEFADPHLAIFERVLPTSELIAVMSTHIVVQGLDPDAPATLSRPVITGILRDELGFDGLVVADDLEMGAIVKNWGVTEAAFRATRAGHDLVPMCHTVERQLAAGRRLDEAVRSGELDPAEHTRALARIGRLAAISRPGTAIATADGDAVARAIARASIHRFDDHAGRLPLAPEAPIALVAARARTLIGVEEDAERDWDGLLSRLFRDGGFTHVTVTSFDPKDDDAMALPTLAPDVRPILFTWDALGQPAMRRVLEDAIAAWGERLVVVHLRNPFDQSLVPGHVTALTTFGYRIVQLQALVEVLAGRLAPEGIMPAPIA